MEKVNKRGNVWFAVSGLVISDDGKWLVVKKKYGGLKGKWSLPAGFVNQGETADQAVIREVKEETGIDCIVKGLIGLRTGVIDEQVSDNMVLFLLEADPKSTIGIQERELFDVKYLHPRELETQEDTSVLVKYMLNLPKSMLQVHEGINPGDQFGYTAYKVFL